MGEALLQSRSEISAEGGGSGWRDGKPTATLSHDDRGGAERRHKGRAERRRSAARCRRSKRQHGCRVWRWLAFNGAAPQGSFVNGLEQAPPSKPKSEKKIAPEEKKRK